MSMDGARASARQNAWMKITYGCPCGRTIHGNGRAHQRSCRAHLTKLGWPLDEGMRQAVLREYRGREAARILRAVERALGAFYAERRRSGDRGVLPWPAQRELIWSYAEDATQDRIEENTPSTVVCKAAPLPSTETPILTHPRETFDGYGQLLELGNWSYVVDDYPAGYGKGSWYPFDGSARLAPDCDYRSWRNEYVLIRPCNSEPRPRRRRLQPCRAPPGHGRGDRPCAG